MLRLSETMHDEKSDKVVMHLSLEDDSSEKVIVRFDYLSTRTSYISIIIN